MHFRFGLAEQALESVESIWVHFFFFKYTFEIRCILSSSLEMLMFFPSHFEVTLCVAKRITLGTIALQKDRGRP